MSPHTVVDASDAAQFEAVVNAAVSVFDGLYGNSGTVGVYFDQNASTGGESNSGDLVTSYSNYKNDLKADSAANPANTVLSTAIANLPHGNDSNGATDIAMTSAMAAVALGLSGAPICFDATGIATTACNGPSSGPGVNYGVVTLGNNLNYSNGNAKNVAEHELDEILGGGGQGSTLNSVYNCTVKQ